MATTIAGNPGADLDLGLPLWDRHRVKNDAVTKNSLVNGGHDKNIYDEDSARSMDRTFDEDSEERSYLDVSDFDTCYEESAMWSRTNSLAQFEDSVRPSEQSLYQQQHQQQQHGLCSAMADVVATPVTPPPRIPSSFCLYSQEPAPFPLVLPTRFESLQRSQQQHHQQGSLLRKGLPSSSSISESSPDDDRICRRMQQQMMVPKIRPIMQQERPSNWKAKSQSASPAPIHFVWEDVYPFSFSGPDEMMSSAETATRHLHGNSETDVEMNMSGHGGCMLQLEDMNDDVQINIMSYLEIGSCRAIMSTNRRFRFLFLSESAHQLWLEWCTKHWPDANQWNDKNLVDDLHFPTVATPSFSQLGTLHQQANLSLLLSLAKIQPTDIDTEQLNHMKNPRRPRRLAFNRFLAGQVGESAGKMLSYQYEPHYDKWVVKFSGRVGQGDRCVRSNHPLPRPTPAAMSWTLACHPNFPIMPKAGDIRKRSQFHGAGATSDVGSTRSNLLDLVCRSAQAVVSNHPFPTWRPFVAPFLSHSNSSHSLFDDAMKTDDNSRPIRVNLTPRYVSYFEISILEDPLDSMNEGGEANPNRVAEQHGHPLHNNPNNPVDEQIEGASSNRSDCVAIGVAMDDFDWHSRMPGWDSFSFGYHGDDGGIFHEHGGMVRQYGPRFGRGDIVGCGVDYAMNGIFFTLNGKFLGYAWTGLSVNLLKKDLYPVVGIDTNDLIHCNYGTKPFHFDLKPFLIRHEDLVRQSLSR